MDFKWIWRHACHDFDVIIRTVSCAQAKSASVKSYTDSDEEVLASEY